MPKLKSILLLTLALCLLATCFAMFAMRGVFGNIEPETMDRQTLIRVMQLRDFNQFSPEMLERLTDRAEQEFGRHSPNRPTFEFSPLQKRMIIYFRDRPGRQSTLANNLTLMSRKRYFQWMNEHQAATLTQRAMLMSNVIEDLRYWMEVYRDYRQAFDKPEQTLEEQHEEFAQMIEDFKIGASPEEVELIDSFAQTITRALFVAEVQQNIFDWLRR